MTKNHFYAKYGTQTTFYFSLEDGSAATQPYTGTDVVAADSIIYKDGGAGTTTTNAVGTTRSPLFSLTLTATELQATNVVVVIYDHSSTVYKVVELNIETKLKLGQADIDATQIGSNTSALVVTGVGTGFGLSTNGASAAYQHNIYTQLEGTEPSGFPSDNASFGAILQFLKRRWSDKRTQTSTTFTQYKDDSSTTCWTATVSDDGTTQSVGKGA